MSNSARFTAIAWALVCGLVAFYLLRAGFLLAKAAGVVLIFVMITFAKRAFARTKEISKIEEASDE